MDKYDTIIENERSKQLETEEALEALEPKKKRRNCNPIKAYKHFIWKRRSKRAAVWWNKNSLVISKNIQKTMNDFKFMWINIVWQEVRMYNDIGKQVTDEDLMWLVKRRGFTVEMANHLIGVLKHMGLGNELTKYYAYPYQCEDMKNVEFIARGNGFMLVEVGRGFSMPKL